MRITIIIHEHAQDGSSVSRTLSPGRSASESTLPPSIPPVVSQGEPQAPTEDRPAGSCSDAPDAAELLRSHGVENYQKLLRSFRPERIIEVCQAADRKKDRLKNPAGYILRALRQGWAV